jgi:GH25 family lysozyme M1 (1,4-beta-N-acetylmuramidase)
MPMLYSGYYTWMDYGSTGAGWAKFPLWLPQYNGLDNPSLIPAPWVPFWTFWQFTRKADGSTYGSKALDMDLNYFNGTLKELRDFFHITKPAPALTDHELLMKVCNWIRANGGSNFLMNP